MELMKPAPSSTTISQGGPVLEALIITIVLTIVSLILIILWNIWN